ncbi:hypothetical protein Ndes2526B_g01667 [Nannochloris sp. 'desiccata']|nr:hypothetical protein NADE_002437 [Chlorella desiccata (nom. nud.)]
MYHSTKLVLGLAFLFVVAAAQSDLAAAEEDDDKMFQLSKLWKKKLHDKKKSPITATDPCPTTPTCVPVIPPRDYMLVVLNWVGARDLDLAIDAPNREIDGVDNECIVGYIAFEDDEADLCGTNYPDDDRSAPGIELVEFFDPLPGEYKIFVRHFSQEAPAEITVTVYAPDFGQLVLTDPEVQILDNNGPVPDEFPERFNNPGILLTFTLPEPTAV